jgi:hypothetical protein
MGVLQEQVAGCRLYMAGGPAMLYFDGRPVIPTSGAEIELDVCSRCGLRAFRRVLRQPPPRVAAYPPRVSKMPGDE